LFLKAENSRVDLGIDDFRTPTFKSRHFDRYLVSSPLTTINLIPNNMTSATPTNASSFIKAEKKNFQLSSQNYQIEQINLDENEPMNSSTEESVATATTSTITNNHTSPMRKITPIRTHFITNGKYLNLY